MSIRNKWIVGVLILFLTLGVGALWIMRSGDPSVQSGKRVLRAAPEFELKDKNGKIHRLTDYKGELILLHFWASWCAPCLDEIPKWREMSTLYQGKSLQFIAINLDDKWEDAEKILPSEKLSPNLVSLMDVGQVVADRYGSFQYPETYLITPQFKILLKWVGSQEWTGPALREAMDQALEGVKKNR